MGERRRIVLKMSGEALASSASDETIDAAVVERLAVEIAQHPRRARPRAGRDGRRRQHLAGHHRGRGRHGPGHLGHHGDAGHGHQRPGPPGRARAPRPAHPGALRRADGRGGRALHPAPGHPPPREGPGGGVRRRHGQPLLHHRHLGRPAGRRDRGRAAVQGHPRRRRRRLHAPTPGSTRPPPATTRSRSWRWWPRTCG